MKATRLKDRPVIKEKMRCLIKMSLSKELNSKEKPITKEKGRKNFGKEMAMKKPAKVGSSNKLIISIK